MAGGVAIAEGHAYSTQFTVSAGWRGRVSITARPAGTPALLMVMAFFYSKAWFMFKFMFAFYALFSTLAAQ